jgi:hypothetical protein
MLAVHSQGSNWNNCTRVERVFIFH